MLGFIHKRVLEVCHPALIKDLAFESVQDIGTGQRISQQDAGEPLVRSESAR